MKALLWLLLGIGTGPMPPSAPTLDSMMVQRGVACYGQFPYWVECPAVLYTHSVSYAVVIDCESNGTCGILRLLRH